MRRTWSRAALMLFSALCCLILWWTAPRSAPAQANGWYYYVQPGDSLYTIARKVGLSVNTLRSANGLGTAALRPKQRLFIPAATTPASQSYSQSGNDTELLARVVMGEAANEPYVGQVAVGAVIMNRIESPLFPNTIAGVIYEPHAFESVTNGLIYRRNPSASARRAASDALSGWDPSGGAIFFFNPAKTNHPFIWSRQIITQIGNHIFAR